MTTAEQSPATDDFVSRYRDGAGIPGTENTLTGAAMHRDLYRKPEDPAAIRKRDAGQARVLGLGFMVFFGVLTCISMWMNGALYPYVAVVTELEEPIEGVAYPAEEEPAEGAEEALDGRLHEGLECVVSHAGPVTAVEVGTVVNDQEREIAEGEGVVNVSVNKDWTSRVVIGSKDFEPGALRFSQGALALDVLPGRQHAWKNAKLMGFLPTRCLLYLGLFLGGLGLFVPVLLVPFYKFWMRYVTAPLGFVNTRLILGIVYFLVLTPMGLLHKIFASDKLRRAPLPAGESYWLLREEQRNHRHFEKGF